MSIADAILTQIRQAGQPRTIKSTETVTGKEPVDIGGMGLLLYMLLEMGKGKGAPGVGPGPVGGLMGMGDLGKPGYSPPLTGQGFGGMDPMQLIMAILGGIGTKSPLSTGGL